MKVKINVISYNIEGLTLEMNYCHDQSLKDYIFNKSKYLNNYIDKIDADIICIQEYTPILNIIPKNFNIHELYTNQFIPESPYSEIEPLACCLT